ncbi:MAG: hypothetical protein NT002_06020 [candidate division Zixibacteria bacterium]|nr:hypothetical protein [candidate division Zixibacteria bacterium]
MEIGFSTEQLIDIGLNFAGFMAAGILTALVYSLFTGKQKKNISLASPGLSLSDTGVSLPAETRSSVRSRDFEFVDFKSERHRPPADNKVPAPKGDSRTRNRQEILRQAMEMKQNLNLQGLARS